ncbi:MAG: hypothetical protein HYU36_04905 [Planctomycetes bacterium]|nr:hypothetical protein [Planctomycetota bacterium]
MPATMPWIPLGSTMDEILSRCGRPMAALARGEVPALVLRGAYPADQCRQLVARLYDRGLAPGLPRPGDLIPDRPKIERVDVGTSLGNLGNKPEEFFAHAVRTQELYRTLFDGFIHPIDLMYQAMGKLAPGKRVLTAREADGRLYGPAIFRCHLPHWGYPPHIDSVRKREKRTGYAVHRFEHQLAGILLLQSPDRLEGYADCVLYNCPWNDEVAQIMRTDFLGKKEADGRVLDKRGFDAYAESRGFERYRIVLTEGDMYFFNSESLHEVPRFGGHRPRIVMATFFGYSEDDPEIFVWS